MGPPGLIGYESPVPVRQSGIDRNKLIAIIGLVADRADGMRRFEIRIVGGFEM